MHPIWLALMLTAAMPAAGRAHPPSIVTGAQERAMADEIVAWRKSFVAVAASKDASKLRDLYAPSFVHTHATGGQSGRDVRIAALLAGEPLVETAPADALVIRVPGGWTAVATATSPIASRADRKTFRVTWTAVYVRYGDGWQLAASQETRLGEVQP